MLKNIFKKNNYVVVSKKSLDKYQEKEVQPFIPNGMWTKCPRCSKILYKEALKKEKVHITFNVTGKWAENKKDLLLRIKNEGHEIGNHGYKHLDYANLSYDENYNQISTSKKIIDDAIGEETKFFQAPAGSFGSNTVKAAQRLNYICFKWDVDTIDWQDRDNPEKIIERVKNKNIVDGSIVLMHPTDATTKCIDDIIQIIRQKNLKPGRLSDVFVVD